MFLNLPDPRHTYDWRREASDMSSLIKCYQAEETMEPSEAFEYLVGRKIEGILSISQYDVLLQERKETEEEARERWRGMVGLDEEDDSWVDKVGEGEVAMRSERKKVRLSRSFQLTIVAVSLACLQSVTVGGNISMPWIHCA